MAFMLEVLYKSPLDPHREASISERVGTFGGRLTFREEPEAGRIEPVCLTYEFSGRTAAEEAASHLRQQGEHVEGPMEYGD